jgi:hypothetical protein
MAESVEDRKALYRNTVRVSKAIFPVISGKPDRLAGGVTGRGNHKYGMSRDVSLHVLGVR